MKHYTHNFLVKAPLEKLSCFQHDPSILEILTPTSLKVTSNKLEPVTEDSIADFSLGWVGGFPQTNLFRNWGPRLSEHLWVVGDSIFPGQSVPDFSLGGSESSAINFSGCFEKITVQTFSQRSV